MLKTTQLLGEEQGFKPKFISSICDCSLLGAWALEAGLQILC